MAYLLTQLLRQSAQRFPERAAAWARKRTLTYAQLEEKSNQLARLLRGQGFGKGDRAGIFFPKAVESIVAMQGVMKAGGIYVPLDPQAPAERISYIIKDCGIRALLTSKAKFADLNATGTGETQFTVEVDSEAEIAGTPRRLPWSAMDSFPKTALNEAVISTDLAYILYTSGSTGRPKGVMLSHLNALTFVEWCARKFQVTWEDRLSNHAPHHFDLSVFDIYNTLEAGATVYMLPDEVSLFPASLAAFIDQNALTIWYSVPSALVFLLLHGNLKPGSLQGLRVLLFAGEVFPMKYLQDLISRMPHTEFYNLYGPTETNVCTYYQVDREKLASMEKLPIGRACENTEVFAVKDDGSIAGIGEEGELLARGTCVTPVYWGDPEKTARGVITNRWQKDFEERAYRTGDLVVLREDGNYDFTGRRDSMIKSRGYRIELGEIEAALLSHPSIREAVALAVPDPEIGSRIRAVVAPQESLGVSSAELQQHCATRIPRYMIPEVIDIRSSLPKTSTGKADRVRLTAELVPAEQSKT
jgi:amino acid adenylation domain-containing protein